MYGLLIEPSHLEDILEGRSLTDNHPFNTKKRGKIALVDSVTKEIKGFAELFQVEPIDYRQYLEQFGGHKMTGDMWAMHRSYYRFHLRQIIKTNPPLKGSEYYDDGVWMNVPDMLSEGKKQTSLFDY